MTALRAAARPMLASIFAIQGFQTMCHPGQVSARAEPVVRPLATRIAAVPDRTDDAVRINGAIQLAAGALLAVGVLPRLSSLALAATLVPTTAAGHRFWEAGDEQERARQRIHFLKNLAIFGGLLIAAADTAGRPSLAWRVRHTAHRVRHDLTLGTRTAKLSAKTGASMARLRGRLGSR